MTKTDFISLPTELAELVSEVTKEYGKQENLQYELYWQDADVWILYQESPTSSSTGVGIATRRVVIAGYDTPGKSRELRFMPDIVVEKGNESLVAAASLRQDWAKNLAVPLPRLWQLFLSDHGRAKDEIKAKLKEAWNIAKSLSDTVAKESVW